MGELGNLSPEVLLIIVGVVGAVAIILIIIIFYYLFRSRKNNAKELEPNFVETSLGGEGQMSETVNPSADDQAKESIVGDIGIFAPGEASSVEIMHLIREKEGSLSIELRGKRYIRFRDVGDPQDGLIIMGFIGDLLSFTNGYIATSGCIQRLPFPLNTGLSKEAMGHFVEVQSGEVQENSNPTRQSQPKLSYPALGITRASLQGTGHIEEKMEIPGGAKEQPRSLADEIDKIIQRRLKASPLFDKVNLRFLTSSGGEVIIQYNNLNYSSPMDIENAEVRSLIQSAIEEWERR